MSKGRLSFAVLTSSVLLVLTAGFGRTSTAGKAKANQLLNESFGLVHSIDATQRAYFLLRLTQVGADISAAREEDWCAQLFEEAHRVDNAWDRVSLEKNALVSLSSVDPVQAFEQLPRVEKPVADASGRFPEDVRADAAVSIFTKYWDHQVNSRSLDGDFELQLQDTLGEIRSQATQIGITGEYPYRAVGEIIKRLGHIQNHEQEISTLFDETVKAYRDGTQKFSNRDAEFLSFLMSSRPVLSDVALLRTAVELFVKNVQINSGSEMVSFQAEYRDEKGTIVKFSDKGSALLFKAFPLIREVHPELARALLETNKDFDKAGEGMQYVSGGVVHGEVTPAMASTMHSRMQQISLLRLIQTKQQTDPVGAVQLADALPDPSFRLVGLSSALPALMKADPTAAKAIYNDQRTRLQELSDDERPRGLVAVAKSAAFVGDQKAFRFLSETAIRSLVASYEKDVRQRPDLRPELRVGFSELRDLVRFAAAQQPNIILERVRKIQDPELKAYLLVYIAEGIENEDN